MLTWRTILRALCIFLAPVFIIGIVVYCTPLVFNVFHPQNPLRLKITNAARKFEFARQGRADERLLTLFDGYFYVATRDICKGETLEAVDLEREQYPFSGEPGGGLVLRNHGVVHRQAAKNIGKDQLVVAADLVPKNESQKFADDSDKDVKTAGFKLEMSQPMSFFVGTVIAVGALVWVYGFVALAVLAFKKHLLWGLSYIFVPFASVVFKLQNWKLSRKYFHALLIGSALMTLGGTLILCYFEAPLSW